MLSSGNSFQREALGILKNEHVRLFSSLDNSFSLLPFGNDIPGIAVSLLVSSSTGGDANDLLSLFFMIATGFVLLLIISAITLERSKLGLAFASLSSGLKSGAYLLYTLSKL